MIIEDKHVGIQVFPHFLAETQIENDVIITSSDSHFWVKSNVESIVACCVRPVFELSGFSLWATHFVSCFMEWKSQHLEFDLEDKKILSVKIWDT